jgi:hypothetical protein
MIYMKTELGRQALRERSDAMPRKFHFPFLMCDGVRDHTDILLAEARTGLTQADIEQMARLGFIQPAPPKTLAETPPAQTLAQPTTSAVAPQAPPSKQQANVFYDASQMATALSAKLGLMGFKLNLAVQAAGSLSDLDKLVPQLEKALGVDTVKPLADLLKTAAR